ncbi:MAG TPA: TetR/AcrR family transcriptional regulator [Fibrobacteria bacterium]|nr:TetR/AcrR family transcriptional regulator [Fibrobacteria bacterium]
MPRTSDKRETLIRAADALFHRRGFERSTIADLAASAAVPLGNVYYYFKTKDDLIAAVVRHRNEASLARQKELEALGSARERLLRFVDRFGTLIESRTAHGCPTGGLCLETNKIGGVAAERAAGAFRQSLAWLARQFRELGRKPKQAEADAGQVMGGLQGAILLANTFKDPEFMIREIGRLKEWLAALPAGKTGSGKTAKASTEKQATRKGRKR